MSNRDMHLLGQKDYYLNRDREMLEWIIEQAGFGRMVTINGIVDSSDDYIYKLRVRIFGEEDT